MSVSSSCTLSIRRADQDINVLMHTGEVIHHSPPYFKDKASIKRMQSGLPFPVRSCWNGMAAIRADAFIDHQLRFRSLLFALNNIHLTVVVEWLSDTMWHGSKQVKGRDPVCKALRLALQSFKILIRLWRVSPQVSCWASMDSQSYGGTTYWYQQPVCLLSRLMSAEISPP